MGTEWIEQQARACYAKKRRCPRIDRTSALMEIEDHEPVALGLRSLPAVSRPKKVRQAEDKVRRAERARKRRAKAPGYKPRSQSLSQTKPWATAGISRSEWYARRKKAPETLPADTRDDFVPGDNAALDGFVPDMIGRGAEVPSGQFRTPHLDIPETPSAARSDETRKEVDGSVPGGAGSALERSPATLTEVAARGGRYERRSPQDRKPVTLPVSDVALTRPPLGRLSLLAMARFQEPDGDGSSEAGAGGPRHPDRDPVGAAFRSVLDLKPGDWIELNGVQPYVGGRDVR